ncbi:MAG TPA: SAF domain-containing protein [Acidimicrobiales bacterium]|nr:SAF domain-containing protein [Acidimicrobiales bacterium]
MRLRRLRRSVLPFWLLALALALVTGATVARLVGEASARAARLGGLVAVPVAARPVAAGAVLRAADVAERRLPAALLPEGRVAGAPVGRSAVVPLVPGEVVLASKLAPDGVRGVAALVPRGRRALAVPTGDAGLPLEPGNHVDVLATFDQPDGADAPTFPVAAGALVVTAGGDSVTVAVSESEAPRVAFALARGTVTLALTGG